MSKVIVEEIVKKNGQEKQLIEIFVGECEKKQTSDALRLLSSIYPLHELNV